MVHRCKALVWSALCASILTKMIHARQTHTADRHTQTSSLTADWVVVWRGYVLKIPPKFNVFGHSTGMSTMSGIVGQLGLQDNERKMKVTPER
jgi:hypothetical protein